MELKQTWVRWSWGAPCRRWLGRIAKLKQAMLGVLRHSAKVDTFTGLLELMGTNQGSAL